MSTPTTDAVVDGLARPTGAVPNGPTYPRARRAPKMSRSGFSAVIVTQPAAGDWKCDSCKRPGSGGEALLGHAARTGHHVFSPVVDGIVVAVIVQAGR